MPAPTVPRTAHPEPAGGSRRAFWAFVAAMVVAVLGGGSIVLFARHAAAERRAEQVRLEAEAAAGRAPAADSR